MKRSLLSFLIIIFWFLLFYCSATPLTSSSTETDPDPPYTSSTSESESLVNPLSDIIFDYMKYPDEETSFIIANEIVYQSDLYGFNSEDIPYILALFYAESNFNSLARNPNSSASGIGQILMSMHGHKFENYEDWKDPKKNLAVAFMILNGAKNSYLDVEDQDKQWFCIYKQYCGKAAYARNALRHVEMFEESILYELHDN